MQGFPGLFGSSTADYQFNRQTQYPWDAPRQQTWSQQPRKYWDSAVPNDDAHHFRMQQQMPAMNHHQWTTERELHPKRNEVVAQEKLTNNIAALREGNCITDAWSGYCATNAPLHYAENPSCQPSWPHLQEPSQHFFNDAPVPEVCYPSTNYQNDFFCDNNQNMFDPVHAQQTYDYEYQQWPQPAQGQGLNVDDELRQYFLKFSREQEARKEEMSQQNMFREHERFSELGNHSPMDTNAYVYEEEVNESDLSEPAAEEIAAHTDMTYPEIVETQLDPNDKNDPRTLAFWYDLPAYVNPAAIHRLRNVPSCIAAEESDKEDNSFVEGNVLKQDTTVDDALQLETLPQQVSEQVYSSSVLESTEMIIEYVKPISGTLCDVFLLPNHNSVPFSFCFSCFSFDVCDCKSPEQKRRIWVEFERRFLQDGEEIDPWLPHSYDLSYSLRPP